MLQLIRNILLEYVDVDPEEITMETNIVNDLNLNSYDFINVIGRLEAELGVEIPERDLPMLETVADVDAYIRKRM